jgi:hypothetical protein
VVAGCGWNHLPQQDSQFLDEPLWDPAGAVATADGLYVRLPAAGALALIPQDGEPELVDVGEGYVSRISASPDGSTVIAFVDRYICYPEDAREARRVKTVEDCDNRDLEVRTEITVVRGGEANEPQEVDGAYNAVAFSDDGRFAIAYLDFSQGFEVDGVINLTGVVVVDLVSDTSTIVPVGFAADRVLFVPDDGGNAARAVVLSRNNVAEVDLLSSPPAVEATFPLTLDPDSQRDPTGVDITADGRYALISTRGSSDLYAIDLDNESINIVDLSSEPATLSVDTSADRTVLVYGTRPVVEVMEHDFFEVDTLDLDEPMNRIETLGGTALLWSTAGQHDLYRLELVDNELVEYRLQNPAVSIHVAPTEEFAVVLTRPEGGAGTGVDAIYDANPGMEVVDLRDDDSEPFLLEGQGLGVAFAHDGTNLNALVLQQGVDYLFRYDLYARQSEEIELADPPVDIGTMPDGTFWITHSSALGLVSFLDPATGDVTEVGGFAGLGIIDPVDLFEEVAP